MRNVSQIEIPFIFVAMNILSAAQIKEADLYTITHEPVASHELMERAGRACFYRILRLSDEETKFYILAGKGNNGGDGLVIARLLAERGRKVCLFIVEHSTKTSPDFEFHFNKLPQSAQLQINKITTAEALTIPASPDTLIIDVLLGTGINRPVEGLLKEVIDAINKLICPVIAVDLPSGLIPDVETQEKQSIIRAYKTLSFQQMKLAFMFAENEIYCGEIEILDIGLDQGFMQSLPCSHYYLQRSYVASLLIPRNKFSHKGSHGHALLIGGSKGKTGAIVLAAKACLRSGAGLLTAHVPARSEIILQTSIPEAMLSLDEEADFIRTLPDVGKYQAIGIGPGLGTDPHTQQVLKLLIQNATAPLVIDADALNILAENKTWLAFLPANSILSPHPKEFDRIAGKHSTGFARLQSAKTLAVKHQLIIILKGAHTAIVLPNGKVFFNSTGNPSLAKGGSGDVLTGILTSLLARGYEPVSAAILGVYLHGLSADLLIKKTNMESVWASDVIEKLGKAFDKLIEER